MQLRPFCVAIVGLCLAGGQVGAQQPPSAPTVQQAPAAVVTFPPRLVGPPAAPISVPAPVSVAAPAIHAAAPTPALPAVHLTPAEVQTVVEVLNDPQKRAAFTATLQTLVKATAAGPAKPAPQAVPLAPDSVGAQLITRGEALAAQLGTQASAFGSVLGHLPAVWRFSRRAYDDPVLRAQVWDAAWRLAAVLGAAGAAEWALTWLLRRPIGMLAERAPGGPRARVVAAYGDLATDAADAELPGDADHATPDRAELAIGRRRFSRTVGALRRLPYVILRVMLDALPLAVFLGVAYGGTLLAGPETAVVLGYAITAYVAARVVIAATRALVSPEAASLRLVHLDDEGAAYILVWTRRLAVVAAAGYAAAQIGQYFGLSWPAKQAFIKTVALLEHSFLVIIVLQSRRAVAGWIKDGSEKRGVVGRIRGRAASVWHLVAIFFIVGLWLVWAASLRDGYARMWRVFLVTAGVLVAARLVGIVLLGGLDRTFRITPAMAQRNPGLEARANRYFPLLRGTLSAVLLVTTGLALLQAWGVNTLAWFRHGALGGQLASTAATILVAGLVALAVWEFTNASLDGHLARLTREAQLARSARLRTLLPILRSLLLIGLLVVFGLTALSEIGLNIGPLLAGAGILGVAIGFGSQKLVQDFITGIFLLLENAMQVGDWVTVAGLSGSVENLSIRTMRLRAGDGSVHIIPFSSVSTVTNVNRGIGNAAVSVNVPVEEDTDHVSDVLADIARDMRGEARFADMMRSDFQLWGVDRVDAGMATIVGQIVCTDGGRWAVQREFNRRLNKRFKELGIRIATPVQTVLNRQLHDEPARVGGRDNTAVPSGQLRESPPPAALGNTA